MSEVKVNKVSPRSGTGLQLGDSGDTITIPSGATIDNQGTATNFGATGSASWTTTVKTADFTAVAGEGYFVNTTSGSKTVTLPAGTAGAVVAFKDYANTFDTNSLVITANGSDKIGGSTDDQKLSTEGIAATLIFIDSTRGWLVTDDGLQSTVGPLTYSADFLVIAGGAGGGFDQGGGGGAGGYRNSYSTESSGGGGSSETAITITPGTVYTITVGDGGAGSTAATDRPAGVASSIAGSGLTTITSVGGGGGGSGSSPHGDGLAGGSGGGAATTTGSAGAGTSNQGFAGGPRATDGGSTDTGGGGGASEAGSTNSRCAGGDGLSSSITGSAVARGGGGGGMDYNNNHGGAPGGSGGGGTGSITAPGTVPTNGTANTGGGGGGGSGNTPGTPGASGGKGVVILRVPTAEYSGTTSGSPTVTNDGSDTVMVFNATGSYTG